VFKERASLFVELAWRRQAFTTLTSITAQRGHSRCLSENLLIGPAFGSMIVNFTSQADYLRVNATYR
jgi:hypothetical protein